MSNNNNVVIYQAASGAIQLRSDRRTETLWATQKQIATIFGVRIPAISKHIKNILEENELERSTISILEIVQQEGKREVNRKVEHYNLDSFIWFLQQANFSLKDYFNPNALTALTLLIVESDPKQKQAMVGLVLQLLRWVG